MAKSPIAMLVQTDNTWAVLGSVVTSTTAVVTISINRFTPKISHCLLLTENPMIDGMRKNKKERTVVIIEVGVSAGASRRWLLENSKIMQWERAVDRTYAVSQPPKFS
jgi:hypothetical protein